MSDALSPIAPVWRLFLSGAGSVRPAVTPQHRRLAAHSVPASGPVCEVRLSGLIDTSRLRAACEQVLATHPATRQRLASAPTGCHLVTYELVNDIAEPDDHARRAPRMPVVELLADGDDHLLRWQLAAGSVDPTGLLRAVMASAAAYCGRTPIAGPNPRTIDAFLDALVKHRAADTARSRWTVTDSDAGTALLARSMRLRPVRHGTSRIRVPVTLSTSAVAGVITLADTLLVRPETVLLTAWRLLLHRVAGGDGALMVFFPGAVNQLADTVGLLGRYVPLPLAPFTHWPAPLPGADVSPGKWQLADAFRTADSELRQVGELADFHVPDLDADHTAGFCYLHATSPNFGPGVEARVITLRAPIDAIRVELQVLHVDEDQLDLTVDADGSSVDPTLLSDLAAWLADLIEQLPQQQDTSAQQVVDRALYRGPAAGPVRGATRRLRSTIVAAFAEQVARTPDACAVQDDRTTLSYRWLQDQVIEASRGLRTRGIGPGDRVAVCMRRGAPLMIAILAALDCGAAFVPLDPALPGERLASLLADVEPRVVLLDGSTSRVLPVPEQPTAVQIDDLLTGAAEQPLDRKSTGMDPAGQPGGLATSAGTAYLIYTSGSTGRPKGVPITHGALMNYLSWAAQEYDTSAGTGTLVHSSISVDMTITSLFLPLLTGQTVTLLPSDDPLDLAEKIRTLRGLSPLKLTPGSLRLLCQLLPDHVLARAVRHLVLGGEQLTPAAWTALHAPGLAITNEYGPTEATVGCCAYTFRLGEPVPDPVPIGAPIWNTTIEIRTADGRAALPGTAGELFVAGAGLAVGYHNRDDETNQRFLLGPWYRTGDLAVVDAAGAAHMIGRLDDQVKIHGYRVEPGEVEAVLASHASIAEVAVIAIGTPPVLHAFLVAEFPTAAADLAKHAERYAVDRLPFYSRPGRYHVISAVPLKRNGKRDRRALLALSEGSQAESPAAAPLRDGIEPSAAAAASIAALWQRLLGSAPAGPDADFFAAGADSIKAVLLAARAQQAGLSLTVPVILEARTLRRIAAAAAPVNRPVDTAPSGPVPLTAHQRGYFNRNPNDPHRWTLRWIADAPHDTDLPRLNRALHQVLTEHPALRTRFLLADGRWTARIADHVDVTVHPVDLSTAGHGDEPAGAAPDRCASTVDLDRQLVRLCLLAGAEPGRTRIAWTVHHLVCDVVSLHLLTERLWHHYHHTSPGSQPQPSLSRTHATDDGYGALLRNETHCPATPFPPIGVSTTRTVAGQVPADVALSQSLASRRAGHQEPVAALAATLLRTLHDVRPDLPAAVCVERHGRDGARDLAGTIGWLTEFRTVIARRDALSTAALIADLCVQLSTAHHSRSVLGASPQTLPAVALNYLGELPADAELPIEDTSAAQPLFGLELVCWLSGGVLHLRWRYSPTFIVEATAGQLSGTFARHASTAPPGQEPADQHALPPSMPNVSAADLQRIAAMFEG